MTDVNKLADSPVLKVVIGFIQAILVAAAVGAFNSVTSSLESIKTQLGTFQTTIALQGQDIESLKRSRDVQQKQVDDLRLLSQRHEFQLGIISETRKGPTIAQSGPKWESRQ